MKRLIFITSLERSGSTLLDITLGKHPNLISFGEVARVLQPHDESGMESVVDRLCSCGAVVRDCSFWGGVTSEIHRHENELSLADRYAIFLSRFDELYGREFMPIDSSKFLGAMDALQEINDLDLRVLFTIRDVRGWGLSSRKADKRKREIPYSLLFTPGIKRFWKAYLRHNILRHFPFWIPLEWYIRNESIDRFLAKKGLSAKRLSYERFSLNTNEMLINLYQFIGVEDMPLNEQNDAHIVRGNRMAFDPKKNTTIRYDAEWLGELWPQYEAMVWPFVMRKNKKWVYES